MATGLKRGANISKKLSHETSSVSLGTGHRGIGCFALGALGAGAGAAAGAGTGFDLMKYQII